MVGEHGRALLNELRDPLEIGFETIEGVLDRLALSLPQLGVLQQGKPRDRSD